jgi:hypothetical protein
MLVPNIDSSVIAYLKSWNCYKRDYGRSLCFNPKTTAFTATPPTPPLTT